MDPMPVLNLCTNTIARLLALIEICVKRRTLEGNMFVPTMKLGKAQKIFAKSVHYLALREQSLGAQQKANRITLNIHTEVGLIH